MLTAVWILVADGDIACMLSSNSSVVKLELSYQQDDQLFNVLSRQVKLYRPMLNATCACHSVREARRADFSAPLLFRASTMVHGTVNDICIVDKLAAIYIPTTCVTQA